MSESDSRTSQLSTACTCRLIATRHPAGMPARLGGVNGGNQWHVEVFGERDSGVGDQPVVGVYDIGSPGPVRTPGLQRQARAQHRMSHGERPGHHVGAEVELVRILRGGDHPHALGDLVGRRVRGGVGVRGATAEHHDLVTRRRPTPSPVDRRGVPARRSPPAGTPTTPARPSSTHSRRARACAKCHGFTACRAADTHARGKWGTSHLGSRRASRAPNRPSARFQPSANRWACARRPDASAPAISRVACACRWAR